MKKTYLVIDSIGRGGAERVMIRIANSLAENGTDTTLLLVNQQKESAQFALISDKVKVLMLAEHIQATMLSKLVKKFYALVAHAIKMINKKAEWAQILLFKSREYEKIHAMKHLFRAAGLCNIIAFKTPIEHTLCAMSKHSNVIISERGDPARSGQRTKAFIHKYYKKSRTMVFQTPMAQEWYQNEANIQGVVIPNPISPTLPAPYRGKRKKQIVNFCRISPQKDLPTLVRGFSKFHKIHPDYELFIYGDVKGSEEEKHKTEAAELAAETGCSEFVHFEPAQEDIHNKVADYAMFVSTSIYEGMSNSMLEAMAIGLPTICTDCPIGGARAVIRNHDNGILIPVGDADALAEAMCEVVENPDLASILSENGTKIRETQSAKVIIDKWKALLI